MLRMVSNSATTVLFVFMNRNKCTRHDHSTTVLSNAAQERKAATPSRRDECEWKLDFACEASVAGPNSECSAFPPARAGCMPAQGTIGPSDAVPAGKPAPLSRTSERQEPKAGKINLPKDLGPQACPSSCVFRDGVLRPQRSASPPPS